MIELTEPDIKFKFKDNVFKYDELELHTKCKHYSKKGVDFIYKYKSKLLLIEVKDFNRKNNDNFIQKKINKSTYKKLEISKNTPFKNFTNEIIQKFNDTLLDLYSSLLNNIEEFEIFNSTKEIVFILVLELPDELKIYRQVIQDKIAQEIRKLNCIFNSNFLLVDSNTKLESLKMEKL